MNLLHANLTGTDGSGVLQLRFGSVFTLALILVACSGSESPPNPYPAAGLVPDSQPGWEQWLTEPDPAAPMDEAQGGRTARGTPVATRDESSFPAEQRNLFYEMDRVVGPDGQRLVPFEFTGDHARDAIRGKNTWILWGQGNEAFWGWLQEDGYGLVDFLVMLDSRDRGKRFETTGIINQPGMKTRSTRRRLGLYLDEADGDAIELVQSGTDIDPATGELVQRAVVPSRAEDFPFALGDPELYYEVVSDLPRDGVDPYVYGYPSGVVGLRLWPNPDFFGDTEEAARAREHWDERVVQSSSDAYYRDWSVQADPRLVRPFRVSMSCGFCHIGPHPLSPPEDPEHPEWGNLSSTIGNQYWNPAPLFANLVARDNFLYHFLASQMPGTVDTSLVSTDHINNANTINAVFDVPARVVRAEGNRREEQSPANLLLPGADVTPVMTPRVLVDGSDSVGLFGALARVYLNIGTFPEEWERSHNPIIGFRPQRPFSIASLQKNSVFWRVAETQRIPYLAAFFTYENPVTGLNVAPPMKLRHASDGAVDGAGVIAAAAESSARGRAVFVRRCAICHSSKQPEGFDLDFRPDWETRNERSDRAAYALTLPMAFADWERFIESRPYRAYVRKMMSDPDLAGTPPVNGVDLFLERNFLSTEIRVPVSLTGTNAGRALATNAMRGQVWGNFSSETYKELPAVGPVHFYNPYSNEGIDEWGNNDAFSPPGGGPGWYRPPSLISLWATAPYLHNNALGIYTGDPSVAGRLAAFEDGIGKLLWDDKRVPGPNDVGGDLRYRNPELAGEDPGFIYRTTAQSALKFSNNFIEPLFSSVLGTFWTSVLTLYVWLALAAVLVILAVKGKARHAAFVWLVISVLLAATLAMLRLDRVYGAWLWLLPLLPLGVAFWFWFGREKRWASRTALGVPAAGALILALAANAFVSGRLGELSLGPIPKGTPVNLIMNMNPEAHPVDLIRGIGALTRGMLIVRHGDLRGEAALEAFENEAGLALLRVSKNPDFVLDRGHWFGESLTDAEKEDLKAFLLTL